MSEKQSSGQYIEDTSLVPYPETIDDEMPDVGVSTSPAPQPPSIPYRPPIHTTSASHYQPVSQPPTQSMNARLCPDHNLPVVYCCAACPSKTVHFVCVQCDHFKMQKGVVSNETFMELKIQELAKEQEKLTIKSAKQNDNIDKNEKDIQAAEDKKKAWSMKKTDLLTKFKNMLQKEEEKYLKKMESSMANLKARKAESTGISQNLLEHFNKLQEFRDDIQRAKDAHNHTLMIERFEESAAYLTQLSYCDSLPAMARQTSFAPPFAYSPNLKLNQIIQLLEDEKDETTTENLGSLYSVLPHRSEYIVYNLNNDKASTRHVADIIFPQAAGFTFRDTSLYVGGGTLDFVEALPTVRSIIDRKVPKVFPMPDLRTARSQNCLAIVGKILVCLGGKNRTTDVCDGEYLQLDSANLQWVRVGSIQTPMNYASAISCEKHSKAYFFGGYDLKDTSYLEFPIYTFSATERKLTKLPMAMSDPIPCLRSVGLACCCSKESSEEDCVVMIFGGAVGPNFTNFSDCIYSLKGARLGPFGQLQMPDTFYGGVAYFDGTIIKAIGRNALHFIGSDPRIIPTSQWHPL